MADDEEGYYRAVQEHFVARRGPPLVLATPDWLLIRKWHKAGTPLRIVLRGIDDALDGHTHSWGRDKPVAMLQYCAPSVEAARERWHRALGLQTEQSREAAEFLRGYADALGGASLGPAARRLADDLAGQLRARAEGPLDGASLEDWLSVQESKLIAALVRDGDGERLASLRTEVDAELRAWTGRLPDRVLKQIKTSAVARRLLAAHGLDRLSLVRL